MSSTVAQSARIHRRNIDTASATIDALKVAAGCVDCGFDRWPEALQFDHVNPSTKRKELGWQTDKSKIKTRAKLARFLEHVAKHCVVRCANCHAHRTKLEQHWRTQPRRLLLGPGADLTLFDELTTTHPG